MNFNVFRKQIIINSRNAYYHSRRQETDRQKTSSLDLRRERIARKRNIRENAAARRLSLGRFRCLTRSQDSTDDRGKRITPQGAGKPGPAFSIGRSFQDAGSRNSLTVPCGYVMHGSEGLCYDHPRFPQAGNHV